MGRVTNKKLLEGIFLANHKLSFFLSTASPKRKAPNFQTNDYFGSLYQYLIAELGSNEHLDRLAVLDSRLNGLKKTLWAMHSLKNSTPAMLKQLDQYHVAEAAAWCKTANGMINVLKSFREGRLAAPEDPSTAFSDLNIDVSSTSDSRSGLRQQKQKHKRNPASTGPITPINAGPSRTRHAPVTPWWETWGE